MADWSWHRRRSSDPDAPAREQAGTADNGDGRRHGVGGADIAVQFRAEWTGVGDPETAVAELLPVRLARACVQVLPVAAAGLSLLNDRFRVPLGASDEMATQAERLQFTAGEGPCLDAARSQRLLVASAADIAARWPVLAEQLVRRTPYRGIVSLPLDLGAGLSGAVDLYATDAAQLAAIGLADAIRVASLIVDALRIAQAISSPTSPWTDRPEPVWLSGPAAERRTQVYIAMGMAMTRFAVTASDALALLRGYSFSHDSDLDETADALVNNRLTLEDINQ